jgi:hypothetical protein
MQKVTNLLPINERGAFVGKKLSDSLPNMSDPLINAAPDNEAFFTNNLLSIRMMI